MAYIRVKQIGTGKIGRIPEENFDPSRYERLDEGLVASLFSPITRSFERMGGLGETMERKKMADEAEKALAAGDYDRAQQLGAMGGKTSPLTAGAREYLTSPLQMTKDLAATASFGVPIAGVAAKPLLKAGALGGFGYGKG